MHSFIHQSIRLDCPDDLDKHVAWILHAVPAECCSVVMMLSAE